MPTLLAGAQHRFWDIVSEPYMCETARWSKHGHGLLVDGLPSFFTDQQLKELFRRYGTVLSAEVVRYPNGESLEFGYVEMATSDEASAAARRLNGTQLYGKVLRVKIDQQERNEPTWGGDD